MQCQKPPWIHPIRVGFPGSHAGQHEIHWTPLLAPAPLSQGHWKCHLLLGDVPVCNIYVGQDPLKRRGFVPKVFFLKKNRVLDVMATNHEIHFFISSQFG
jgi:hypothetical protein